MDAQELRNLQEAYMEVVENQQLDEASGGIIGGKTFSCMFIVMFFIV